MRLQFDARARGNTRDFEGCGIALVLLAAVAAVRWPRTAIVLVALSPIVDRYIVADLLAGEIAALSHYLSEALLLTVDHDPRCMYYTLLAERGEGTFDFRYLEDALSPRDAVELLRRHAATKAERIARLEREGYPIALVEGEKLASRSLVTMRRFARPRARACPSMNARCPCEFDSPTTMSAFALGFTLVIMTLLLNVVALIIVKRYRERYV